MTVICDERGWNKLTTWTQWGRNAREGCRFHSVQRCGHLREFIRASRSRLPGVGAPIVQNGSAVWPRRRVLSDSAVRDSLFHSIFKCHQFYWGERRRITHRRSRCGRTCGTFSARSPSMRSSRGKTRLLIDEMRWNINWCPVRRCCSSRGQLYLSVNEVNYWGQDETWLPSVSPQCLTALSIHH